MQCETYSVLWPEWDFPMRKMAVCSHHRVKILHSTPQVCLHHITHFFTLYIVSPQRLMRSLYLSALYKHSLPAINQVISSDRTANVGQQLR